jgi:hypothetical protein
LCNIKLLRKNCCPSLLVYFLFTSSIFSNVLRSVAPQASPSISHVHSCLHYIRHMPTSFLEFCLESNQSPLPFILQSFYWFNYYYYYLIFLFSSVHSATGVTMIKLTRIYSCRFYQTNYSYCRQIFFKTEKSANNVARSKHWCWMVLEMPSFGLRRSKSICKVLGTIPVADASTNDSSVTFYAHSHNCEKGLLGLSCLSVCSSVHPPVWNTSAVTGRVIIKFYSWVFFENISNKLSFIEISQE